MPIKSGILDEKVWKIGKNRGLRSFLREKWGFRGFGGGKVGFLRILRDKRGHFDGFTLIGEFLGKIRRFAEEMREKECGMSGAAARTGRY